MKKKLFISIIISAIIYIITILIGLIRFNPLAEILFSGIKLAISTFILTLFLFVLIDHFRQKSTQTKQKNQEKTTEQSDQKSNPNVTKKYQESTKANQQTNEEDIKTTAAEENFEAMQPPVVEYDEE